VATKFVPLYRNYIWQHWDFVFSGILDIYLQTLFSAGRGIAQSMLKFRNPVRWLTPPPPLKLCTENWKYIFLENDSRNSHSFVAWIIAASAQLVTNKWMRCKRVHVLTYWTVFCKKISKIFNVCRCGSTGIHRGSLKIGQKAFANISMNTILFLPGKSSIFVF